MSTKNEMELFLEDLAIYHTEGRLTGLPALLLEKGLWFEGRAGSDEYTATKKWKKKRKPRVKDCFYNSQEFCTEHDGVQYFEGFVLVHEGVDPSKHAWVVMKDSRVVDFTLEVAEVVVAEMGHAVDLREALYVGLEVPKAFILERLNASDWYDSIAELFYADEIKRIVEGEP